MARGKYQLQAAHYFPGDIYLEPGTLVGDGTQFPVEGPPSFNMIPMDPVAQAEWDAENQKGKEKPEIPSSMINPTGNNPVQGPRASTGTVSAPGGIHGPRGLAEPPRSPLGVEAAKAMAVQAAMIPQEELDRAVEVERARQADIDAAAAVVRDKAEADQKAREEWISRSQEEKDRERSEKSEVQKERERAAAAEKGQTKPTEERRPNAW